ERDVLEGVGDPYLADQGGRAEGGGLDNDIHADWNLAAVKSGRKGPLKLDDLVRVDDQVERVLHESAPSCQLSVFIPHLGASLPSRAALLSRQPSTHSGRCSGQ